MLKLFGFISITIIMLYSTWLLQHTPPKPHVFANNTPDAYMENITALVLDKTGNPRLKIASPKMVHYTEKDQSQFSEPTLTVYRTEFMPWIITAKYAKAIAGMDEINFWQDVTLHHTADRKGPETLIKTAQLNVFTKTQLAKTEETITLIQPNLVSQATGMVADMRESHVQLLNEARAFYTPDE